MFLLVRVKGLSILCGKYLIERRYTTLFIQTCSTTTAQGYEIFYQTIRENNFFSRLNQILNCQNPFLINKIVNKKSKIPN
jgi:hypothetical protein